MGRIVATCGHDVGDVDSLVHFQYRGQDCDAIDGFRDCVFYVSYCKACHEEAKTWPEYIGVSGEG